MKLMLIRELHQLLERVPKLVDLYESKRTDFLPAVRDWILDGEKVLTRFGLPQVAALSGLRGFLAAADEGVFEASFNIPDNIPRYRSRAAVGVQTLERTSRALQEILEPELKRVEEAGQVLKQVLVMNGVMDSASAREDKEVQDRDPEQIWHRLWRKDDTRTLMRHVLTLVSYEDARELTGKVVAGWFAVRQ